jgi:hypothetical protein
MADAREDVWGEAAIRQPGGPSYEFFRDLLPPLRYVNTSFRHYPIVLSAPLAPVKARWVSNGSGVNLRADKPPMWKEAGTPVRFFVGEKEEAFGADIGRVSGPHLSGGWLPVVRTAYSTGGVEYRQEAFAPVRAALAERGAVMLNFAVPKKAGRVAARVGTGKEAFTASGGAVLDEAGRAVVLFGGNWKWNEKRKQLTAELAPGAGAELLVLTKPGGLKELPDFPTEFVGLCKEWTSLLERGAGFDIPEPRVRNAWRALAVAN